MSKLLIEDRPLVFSPKLAEAIGVNKAIILQQVHYLCTSGNSGKFLPDGKKYVWNSYKDWKKNYFPFWSVRTIERIFTQLEDKKLKLLVSKKPYSKTGNHTKYYRVSESKLTELERQIGVFDADKMAETDTTNSRKGNRQNGDNSNRQNGGFFPKTSPETSSEISSNIDCEIWENFLSKIKQTLNPQIFDAWIKPLIIKSYDKENKVFEIQASVINQEWIIKNYADLFLEVFHELGIEDHKISWCILKESVFYEQ